MLIEQAAYTNRWRRCCPLAKLGFAFAGLLAAHLASTPVVAAGIALSLGSLTVLGAGVSLSLYARVAAPAVGFLALSCLSLAISLGGGEGGLHWAWASDAMPQIAELSGRSLAALAALLFLVLTTPLPDLIATLRRLYVPEALLDLMVLCYRMLFVFSEAMQDTLTAQKARLGFVNSRRSMHSLGLLTASLSLQIWLRARDLHQAALARHGDGPLRFLAVDYPAAGRDRLLAGIASACVLMLTLGCAS